VVSSIMSPKLVQKFGKRKVVGSGMLIVALGVLLLSTLGIDVNYGMFVLAMCTAAFGMGIAMSPTTDLMMSAVPRSRAGMGSATNDTTRELGGSLGVAILGSLLAAQYSEKIIPAVSQLPQQAQVVAESSLAGALRVAQMLPSQIGGALSTAAKTAWLDGYSHSLIVGAIVIAASATIAFKWLPNQSEESVDEIVHG